MATIEAGLRVGLVLGSGGELLRRWEGDWYRGGREVYAGPHRFADAGRKRHAATAIERSHARRSPPPVRARTMRFAQARRWIEMGLADVCLAGGVETITPICRSAFNNLRALSRRTDEPAKGLAAVRYRSRRLRDGRRGRHLSSSNRPSGPRRRGARIYAEVAGFGATSDAFHMIIPSSDPAPAAAAMQAALDDAGIQPHEVDYINAHATSTPVGDKGEARALHAVFGEHVANVPVSSTKSMTGHLLSAAAAVEALACLAALERQKIPPTINLDTPDPECDLCHVPHQAIAHPVNIALSNSFGFGGSNTTLILRKAA